MGPGIPGHFRKSGAFPEVLGIMSSMGNNRKFEFWIRQMTWKWKNFKELVLSFIR